MNQTLVFMPINPKNGKPAPYNLEEFHEQLTRFGIEMPELEEGSQYYSLTLPASKGSAELEQEVMILVEDEVVLGVSIDEADDAGKAFWLQLLQMGYIMREADSDRWKVGAAWAAEFQKAGSKAAGIDQIEVISSVADF
jgi:hypothetical protein